MNVWLPLARSTRVPGSQPRHVLRVGTKLLTLWFAGQHSTHWATPAGAQPYTLTKWQAYLQQRSTLSTSPLSLKMQVPLAL